MNDKIAAEIQAEQNHGRSKYGRGPDDFDHDENMPWPCWHACIGEHNRIASNSNPMDRRQHLIKVAGLAVSAIEAFDRVETRIPDSFKQGMAQAEAGELLPFPEPASRPTHALEDFMNVMTDLDQLAELSFENAELTALLEDANKYAHKSAHKSACAALAFHERLLAIQRYAFDCMEGAGMPEFEQFEKIACDAGDLVNVPDLLKRIWDVIEAAKRYQIEVNDSGSWWPEFNVDVLSRHKELMAQLILLEKDLPPAFAGGEPTTKPNMITLSAKVHRPVGSAMRLVIHGRNINGELSVVSPTGGLLGNVKDGDTLELIIKAPRSEPLEQNPKGDEKPADQPKTKAESPEAAPKPKEETPPKDNLPI